MTDTLVYTLPMRQSCGLQRVGLLFNKCAFTYRAGPRVTNTVQPIKHDVSSISITNYDIVFTIVILISSRKHDMTSN